MGRDQRQRRGRQQHSASSTTAHSSRPPTIQPGSSRTGQSGRNSSNAPTRAHSCSTRRRCCQPGRSVSSGGSGGRGSRAGSLRTGDGRGGGSPQECQQLPWRRAAAEPLRPPAARAARPAADRGHLPGQRRGPGGGAAGPAAAGTAADTHQRQGGSGAQPPLERGPGAAARGGTAAGRHRAGPARALAARPGLGHQPAGRREPQTGRPGRRGGGPQRCSQQPLAAAAGALPPAERQRRCPLCPRAPQPRPAAQPAAALSRPPCRPGLCPRERAGAAPGPLGAALARGRTAAAAAVPPRQAAAASGAAPTARRCAGPARRRPSRPGLPGGCHRPAGPATAAGCSPAAGLPR